jgi:hypothetical protein
MVFFDNAMTVLCRCGIIKSYNYAGGEFVESGKEIAFAGCNPNLNALYFVR